MTSFPCFSSPLQHPLPNQLHDLLVGSDLIPFLGILISYAHIVSAVLKVPSAQGKQKAFYLWLPPAVVILFYGTITGVYLSPSPSHAADKDSLAAMYMVVTL